jgi:uncharacterized protein (DUF2225 family)
VRPSADRPHHTESDNHVVYNGPFNPTNYAVWVCPADLYAAFPTDFLQLQLSPSQVSRVPGVVAEVVAKEWGGEWPDFNMDRNLDLRERSLQLALALYSMRGASPARLAGVKHQLAWCARERQDSAAEQAWLQGALDGYLAAYTTSNLDSPKTEIRVAYLCGELALRLGDERTAVKWFWQVTRHPSIHQYPVWARRARERWPQLGDSPTSPP